jgi:hypothetical protein
MKNGIVKKRDELVFLVYLFLSISNIRATRTQLDMKKMLMFFDTQPSDNIVCVF